MKKLQVKVDFARYRDAELETLGHTIVAHMTGNEHFAALAPDVALVQNAHVAYAQALAEAADGGKLARAIKDDKRAALRKALHDLGLKINMMARGNEVALAGTGYDLVAVGGNGRKAVTAEENRVAVKTDPLDKAGPISFQVFQGTGSVEASVDPVDGAVAYFWQYTDYPVTAESNWITVATTRNSYLFSGLTIGNRYSFKVAGIGYDPTLSFSDIATSFAI